MKYPMTNISESKRKLLLKGLLFILLIFVVGGVGGVFFDQRVLPFIRTNRYLSKIDFLQKTAENVTIINKTEQITIKEDDSINEIASQASNAVVNIISVSTATDALNKTPKIADQSATGIVVTSDGMIATYREAIIEKNAKYKAFLYDGSNFDASLVGIDEFSNMAFLKINASNLTAISFADSTEVRPGKRVVAIGNSFGEYQNRYSAGLLGNISKTFNLSGQTVSSTEKLEGVFETDMYDKVEFVGGPVIGYSGDMIGIIGKLTIDNQDRYFEVPSDAIRQSIRLALDGKLDSRPFFGAYYLSITKEYSIAHNLDQDRGAIIFSPSGKQGLAILSGSPAEKAGLRIGDIVTMVGAQGVNLDNPLSNLLAQYMKGDAIELTVARGDQEIKVPVKL
jgi:serine protease Do